MLKKAALWIILFFVSLQCHAAGSITHMFIAKEIIPQLPDKELQHLIENNMDAYLVGSNYPDTGYIQGAHYGDASHWETFINTFVDYLHERYSYPEQQNPELVAFLLGCATHILSDQIFHGVFMHQVAANDFQGNWENAHISSERGLDLLINIEKNQWGTRPVTWWLPLQDLVSVYQKLGKKQHSISEILWGNTVYSFAGIGERAISPLGYYYIKSKMPWLAKHYYDSPQGGILMTEQATAHYVLSIWNEIAAKKVTATVVKPSVVNQSSAATPSFTFAKTQPSAKSGWYGNYRVEFI